MSVFETAFGRRATRSASRSNAFGESRNLFAAHPELAGVVVECQVVKLQAHRITAPVLRDTPEYQEERGPMLLDALDSCLGREWRRRLNSRKLLACDGAPSQSHLTARLIGS